MSLNLARELKIQFFDNPLCAESDPDAFFPEQGSHNVMDNKAKAICYFCSHRVECLNYALLIDDRFAIMGSLTPRARRALRKSHMRKFSDEIKEGLTVAEIALKNQFSVEYVTSLLEAKKIRNQHSDKASA